MSKAQMTKTTLEDYGYKVSTGQLVWNRLKPQISKRKTKGAKPIIWAEAIGADGEFSFEYQYRKDLKYIKNIDKQKHLVCKEPVVLVQRTTAKEQERRLQACILPQNFIDKYDGVVVENHVNIVRPVSEKPKLSLQALSLLLNSRTVDRFFRCLSGSVAVSATELHAIPLPFVERLAELEKLAASSRMRNSEEVEQIIMEAYGLEEGNR